MLANVEPVLFQLKDLMKATKDGYYYKEQLTLCDPPKESDFFPIEKILHKKVIKRQTFYYVKYLYYSSKFNQYVPERNIKGL